MAPSTRTAARVAALVGLPLAAAFQPDPARAQGLAVELRAGVVASSPLVRDDVLDPTFAAGFGEEREFGRIEATPSPAPILAVAARTALRDRLGLEAEIGWTFAELRGDDGLATWTMQDVGIGHAVLGLRYALRGPVYVRGGVGAIRFATEARGVFAEGSEPEALLHAAVGGAWPAGPARVTLELLGQAHSFATPAFRRAGGVDGTVYRLGVRVGVAVGGATP